MADHSDQTPSIVVQIPAYGHANHDDERWHDRWTALSKVIQYTRGQMSHAQRIAGQELATFQSAWAQAHATSDADLHRQYAETLANLDNLLVDLKSTTPADAARTEQALLFLSDIAHRLLPRLAAYQAAQDCTELLDHLHDFAQAVYGFFTQALYPPAVTPLPNQSLQERLTQTAQSAYFVSERYTPDVVMATLMEQISIDLNIVKQVFHQRYSEFHDWDQTMNKGDSSDPLDDPQRPSLLVADRLAHLALQPALEQGFFANHNQRAITYMSRRVDVRLLPYADSVLIGIPYTAQSTFSVKSVKQGTTTKASVLAPFAEQPSTTYTLIIPTDYLAIPHEIGHHLYRYGKAGKEPLHQILQRKLRARLARQAEALQNAGWRLRWLEEVFADVYGCMIAGPISVFGFQDYLAQGQPIAYDQHVDKHPINVLRPFLQTQILRCLTDQAGNRIHAAAADLLDARWRQWVKDHWPHWVAQQWPHGYDNATDILRDATYVLDGKSMSGRDILHELQPMIGVSLLVLSKLRPSSEQATWTPHWHPQNHNGQAPIADLYQDFVSFAFRSTIQATLHKHHTLTAPEAQVAATTSPAAGHFWLLEQLTQLQQARLIKPVIENMVDLILFDGWSTEGPQGENER